MEVEPSTWYSSRVTLPSHDPAHWRLTSQPCLCPNHHSTWALPLCPLPPHLSISLYFLTPLYLPIFFHPSLYLSPSLWTSPLDIYLSISIPLYLCFCLSPLSLNLSRSHTPSLDWSKPPYLSTPLSPSLDLSPTSLSPLDLSPPPPSLYHLYCSLFDLSISRCLSISRHLSISLLSRSFSPLFPSLSLYRSTPLYLSTHLYLPLPLPPSPPFLPLYISPSRSGYLLISIDTSLNLDTSSSPAISLLSISPPFSGPLASSFDISPSLDRYLSQHLSIPLPRSLPSLYLTLSLPLSVFLLISIDQ